MKQPTTANVHVPGVDSLRFICALWVLLGHAGGVPLEGVLRVVNVPAWLLSLTHDLNGVAFDNVAAVMVFFIISGFCIHFPTRNRSLRAIPFWVRRLLRIGIPLLAATICAYAVSGRPGTLAPVLWSLYCELIYYALYPALLWIASRTGWGVLLSCSFLVALVLSLRPDAHGGFFWTYGPMWTWVLGLPVWLTGVVVAEGIDLTPRNEPSKAHLWLLRIAVWFFSALAAALQFHSPLHYKITMLLFCPLGAGWFFAEVKNAVWGHVSPILEAVGKGSYSLYLCHLIALNAVSLMYLSNERAAIAMYATGVASALCLSASFYLLVERPAHRLAKWAAKNLTIATMPGMPAKGT